MCSIDFDSDGFSSEREITARKEHRCSCCGARIVRGEQYTRHFSVYDGNPSSENICALCVAARKEFGDAHGFSWCTPSYFPDLLRECIDDRDAESTARWGPMLAAINLRGSVEAGS